MKYLLIISTLCLSLLWGCQQGEHITADQIECTSGVPNYDTHPKATQYQSIVDAQVATGLPGAILYVRDAEGPWLGASGKASLELDLDIETCHRSMIASISKVFTAVVIHKLVDEGKLSLSDSVSQWLDAGLVKKIKNADQVTLEQCLAHKTGFADYYTAGYELDRFNKVDNGWKQEDVLRYVYGKAATDTPGTRYRYSNTNYLLLGMIAEFASDESLAQLYDRIIFSPLKLASAYYSGFEQPIPPGTVSGYGEIYKDKLVDTRFLYKDELKMGDGGIAIKAYDLGLFMEAVGKGELLSASSQAAMMDFFDLPEDQADEDIGFTQNGLGIEVLNTPYGQAIGHNGAIDGFISNAFYFPATDRTLIVLTNSASFNFEARQALLDENFALMFQ